MSSNKQETVENAARSLIAEVERFTEESSSLGRVVNVSWGGLLTARDKLRAALTQPDDAPPTDGACGFDAGSVGDQLKRERDAAMADRDKAYIALEERGAELRALRKDSQPARAEAAEAALAKERERLEELLDEDGPIFLTLREAIAEGLEAGGFMDEEGEPLSVANASAKWLGSEVSDRIRAALSSKGGSDA